MSLKENFKFILDAHVLNWPWLPKDIRRNRRYKATQKFIESHLKSYIPEIRAIKVPEASIRNEKERIFSIWMQNEVNAPKIVKSCLQQLRRLSSNEVVVLDEESIGNWITLPPYIMEKWKSGKIRAAHFADICRVELLYQYGGIWIDATAFVTSDFPRWVMEHDFFLYMAGSNIKGYYSFVQNCFIRAKKGNRLLGIWREAMFKYWEKEEKAIDYFIHQLLFKACVENNDIAAKEFEAMPKLAQDCTHTIWFGHRNDKYNEEEFFELTKGSFFQKTEYKSKESKIPPAGSFAEFIVKGTND